MRDYYAGDPYWISARFAGKCSGCGEAIKKGARAFYYPKGKHIFCEHCGEWESERFNALAEDEYNYNHGGY